LAKTQFWPNAHRAINLRDFCGDKKRKYSLFYGLSNKKNRVEKYLAVAEI